MLDHQEARMWADHHQSLSTIVADLVDQTKQAFVVLAAIRYDRPWQRDAGHRCAAKF